MNRDDLVQQVIKTLNDNPEAYITGAEIRAMAAQICMYQAEMLMMNKKLMDGTLHCLICNGDHSARVGAEGRICNCTLGQEIKHWRRKALSAEARLKLINDALITPLESE